MYSRGPPNPHRVGVAIFSLGKRLSHLCNSVLSAVATASNVRVQDLPGYSADRTVSLILDIEPKYLLCYSFIFLGTPLASGITPLILSCFTSYSVFQVDR